MKKKSKKLIFRFIFVIALAVFVYSAFQLFTIFKANYDEKEELNHLIEVAQIPDEPDESFVLDFDKLININTDVNGWIYLPNTTINYPVVKGTDNDYYLNATFEKKSNYVGAIFMDYRLNPDYSNRNSMIYGHNVKHGTMFADINKYLDPTFFAENPYAYLYTPDKTYKLEIFSMYSTDAYSDAYQISFLNDVTFMNYISWIKAQSANPREVEVTENDRIITLSTCSYERGGVASDARYVLHAKLVEVDS